MHDTVKALEAFNVRLCNETGAGKGHETTAEASARYYEALTRLANEARQLIAACRAAHVKSAYVDGLESALGRAVGAHGEASPQQGYTTEFPDYDASTLPSIPAHWEDKSYRNDCSPFWLISPSLGVFIDYADEAQREFKECSRFTVVRMEEGQHCDRDEGPLLATDDWQEVLAFTIGETFAANIEEQLSADELAEVKRRNAHVYGEGICATHDYCDANMPMAEAFEFIMGREPDVSADDDVTLWNAAWERARADHFTAEKGQ